KVASVKAGAGTHRFDFKFSYPVRGIFINARNATREDLNDRSRYDTNAGATPISTVTLSYDNTPRCDKFPFSHFDYVE
ncbi:hypothetical protein NL533_36060, partial [Klebsiella pneumoniae]|nr:hypothetical protein [Klebsiella pneumoniae]